MRSPGPPPSRRAVLGAALAGLAAPALGGCTAAPAPAGPPPVPDDVVAADRAAERERALLAAYDAALLLAPVLAPRLQPVRDDHAAHLTALLPPEPEPTAPAAAATASPTTPAPTAPTPPAPVLPADPAALLAALGELERRAATAHARDAVLRGRGVGALLAAVSASEASHAVALA